MRDIQGTNGEVKPTANNLIHCELEGNGEISDVSNDNPTTIIV